VCEGILGIWGALSAAGSLESEEVDPGVCSCKDEEAADVSVLPLPVVLLVLVVPALLVTVAE
jgi:hypothetical protein